MKDFNGIKITAAYLAAFLCLMTKKAAPMATRTAMSGTRMYMTGKRAESSISAPVGSDVSISLPGAGADVSSGTNSNPELHMSPESITR
jgi:hypothetical protein